MHFVIEKLKITNFLSFFGEFEVSLKPFTAVLCNFFEGKDDLMRALEFVFGARLMDLKVENPLDLVNEVLREEFLINRDVQSFVEITLNFLPEKKSLKFCKSIKNGATNPRIEHKISDLVTTRVLYEEKLNSLNIFIQEKNLIFYKNYFDSIIWGSAEDLEKTITNCLREPFMFEDWKKANKNVQNLKRLKNLALQKNYNSIKKTHAVVAKFTEKYEKISAGQERTVEDIIQEPETDSSYETNSSTDFTEEVKNIVNLNTIQNSVRLEKNLEVLREKFHELALKEAFLISYLYHEEIKLGAKPVNASILQNRLNQIKTKIREKENQLSEIWENMNFIKTELETLNQSITFSLISFYEIRTANYRQNRFTSYGRFYDYLQPSRYIQFLKQIIGNDIFYAHLCDTFQEAVSLLKQIKDLCYEEREVFIPFENYSHKLKDLIIASGEKGIQINTLEELLIFLCKLQHYQFINDVPIIIQRDFYTEDIIPKDYVIYINNDIYFTSEGTISKKVDENGFPMESEIELKDKLIQFFTEEETKYQRLNDLIVLKSEILFDMSSLENDITYLKSKWRKSSQKPHAVGKSSFVTEIYEEFSGIFKEYEEAREKSESELLQTEEQFLKGDSSTSSNEENLTQITEDLERTEAAKNDIKKQLEDTTFEIRSLDFIPTYNWSISLQKYLPKFQNNVDQRRLFFEQEFKKLKKLLSEDDLEDFLGSQEWRRALINSLMKDFDEIKTKFKISSEELQNIASERKQKLYQLFEHCSRYLYRTFRDILDDELPFIEISFDLEERIHITSSLENENTNAVDLKHFNTFIKFTTALSLCLEIARFDEIPLMIFDNVEEYFPHYNDSLESVLDEQTLEKIIPNGDNPRFHLLMRIGQFLKNYIRKNIPSSHVRSSENFKGYNNGPLQILYFTKEDFAFAAEHYIWIQNQILPDEYVTEKCSSYSEIHEINLTDLNI